LAVSVTKEGTTKPAKTSGAASKASEKPAKAEKPKLLGLSQEQIARLVGCAQSTVSRAIARGDISTLSDGSIREDQAEILRELRASDERVSQETAQLERRLLLAETGEKEAKAKLRQLELEREQGRFIELAAVERAGADAAQRILAVLRAMPQRIALEVDAALAAPADRRAAAVEKIVSREIERAVDEMRKSLYLQAAVPPAPGGGS
jgi:predicted transcriptional regulator